MKFLMSKKGVALLATLVVAAVAAFGAYAYFTAAGSGSGTASVGSASGIQLSGSCLNARFQLVMSELQPLSRNASFLNVTQ